MSTLTEEDKKKRNFRVYWQHLETLNWDTYPKYEPLFTFEEAENKALKERQTGYLRSWVIDRQGLSY